ncbi:MAG: 4-(cytidine 5'-diphospho)-2-C-methyl-D-erythritol kinase [Clostridiales bacterium]|nr:4-(cytidine 5'-diphospho)-2-C-methyl-D-erythritol kinase [Clostridiales bacterium]
MDYKAYAKVNLSIDVIGERADGYHEVRMIMQSINLYDVLKFDKIDDGIKIFCMNPYVPRDEKNTVYKALDLLKEKYSIPWGMEVEIKKSIPVAAGLAGGSSDAASAIVAANDIWNLNMDHKDMMEAAKAVGADVPFCIKGGTALAEGIGEKITRLASIEGIYMVVAKPAVSVSTKDIYRNLKLDEIVARPDIDKIVQNIQAGNVKYIANHMVNVLETVTVRRYPVIGEIKGIIMQSGALGSLMSGSGPAVFGIFENHGYAEKCYDRLRDYLKEVYVVRTIGPKLR